MESIRVSAFFHSFSRLKRMPFLRENGKLIVQFILTLLFMGLGIWFLKHERAELAEVKSTIAYARWTWVVLGICVTFFYVLLQGLMYLTAFHSIQCKVSLRDMVYLFLKRNFISVFLPAGGVSSLAFFTGPLEKKGISRTQIHYASTLYGFVGILTVIIVAIPALLYAFYRGNSSANEWIALAVLLLISGLLYYLYRLLLMKGRFYNWVLGHFPSVEMLIEDVLNNKVLAERFLLTVFISLLIEFTGIAHVFIAMSALHVSPSLFAAVMAYVISVIFMIVSPFLRGLGAIEVSMSIILVRFGFSNVEAISITLLYRLFEFWLPLLSGVISFLAGINKLLMRVIPATMILLLGIINIVSVLTPAIAGRVERLQDYIMLDIIHASNYFVLAAGFFLLVTAAFMLKGLRTTWWIALILSMVSFIGHITKAIDYEEAAVALLIIVILLFTYNEYYVKNRPRLRIVGWRIALFSVAAILVYGVTGFFLLDKKHFNVDFNLLQSVQNTLANYFLISSDTYVPRDAFARDFIYSINAGGFLSMAFLLYTLVWPFIFRGNASEEERAAAGSLLSRFGRSALDYFKILPDKMIFYETGTEAFISYRITGNFAVVLEIPVAGSEEEMKKCISLFDTFCYENSLKSIYYRVPEESLPLFTEKKKKSMLLGQEAVLDLDTFSLEGGHHKSLRNAINRIKERGYKASVHQPPVKDGILQKLKSVSDDWLYDTGRNEIIFSQGMFVWGELKNQTVITVENAEEKVIAFLNIIPDFAPSEGTYDLMRKTADAPNGIMDFILIELFGYFKSQNFRYVNLGFAPMSGLNDAQTFGEKSMKFAYEKIRSFSHFKGLREFKDKFGPQWFNKYLIYDYDYDLIQIPAVLARVIRPS
jgi:phosphatidylglycerol lysyltransferase